MSRSICGRAEVGCGTSVVVFSGDEESGELELDGAGPAGTEERQVRAKHTSSRQGSDTFSR